MGNMSTMYGDSASLQVPPSEAYMDQMRSRLPCDSEVGVDARAGYNLGQGTGWIENR